MHLSRSTTANQQRRQSPSEEDACMQDADVAFMRDMAAYMRVDDTANDGMHGPIRHMVWWDWNPNSGDTGGLVNDGWTVVRDSCDML